MKRFFVFTLSVLFIISSNILIGAIAKDTTEKVSDEFFHLQTVAASDSDYDQFIKNEVSAAAYKYITDIFEFYGVSEISEAVATVKNNIVKIRNICITKARAEGCSDPVFVELVSSDENSYSAARFIENKKMMILRIKIGDGCGHNCRKLLWPQDEINVLTEENTFDGYTVATSAFPSDVKIDFWIVNALKKIAASFE